MISGCRTKIPTTPMISGSHTQMPTTQKEIREYLDTVGFKKASLQDDGDLWLTIEGTDISDLSPLKGLPLEGLYARKIKIRNIDAIKGMPIKALWISDTEVSDLNPLRGSPIRSLCIRNSAVKDLSPLSDTQLKYLYFTPENITVGMDVLRSLPTLKRINHDSVGKFFEKYDSGKFSKKRKSGQTKGYK